MLDMANGDFRLVQQPRAALPIPLFPDERLPGLPTSPMTFSIDSDYMGNPRDAQSDIGAFSGSATP
jgi:hypothetical protein